LAQGGEPFIGGGVARDVGVVGRDSEVEGIQLRLGSNLFATLDMGHILDSNDAGEQGDDRHHDHHFDERHATF